MNADRPLVPCGAVLLAAMLGGPADVFADGPGWPHWRGPGRNGVSPEPSGWNGAWAVKEAWRAEVGEGGSSPLIIGRQVVNFGWKQGRDHLTILALDTGKVVWEQSYASPQYGRRSTGDKRLYSGATATPESDEETDCLYTLSTDGDLRCWRFENGHLVWQMNLYERFKTPRRPDVGGRRSLRDYGYTTAPLVYKDWLLVEAGSSQGNLIAVDKRSGKLAWTSECRDEAGHTGGPTLIRHPRGDVAVVLTLRNLVLVSLQPGREGATVASAKWTTDFGNNIATPSVVGNSVLVTSAYNHYAMARFDYEAETSSLRKIWETEGVASGVCSPVIHKGRVYWAWRGVHCLDLESGKEMWVGGNVGAAGSCLVTSDDRLVVLANRGDLSLIETATRSPEGLKSLATRKLEMNADVWPHVAVSNGRLLAKDRHGLVICLRIGE